MIEFTEIRPPEFHEQFYRLYLLGAMSSWAKDAQKEYEKTVEFWHGYKPVFDYRLSTGKKGSEEIVIQVYTENSVYSYVDYGVPAHDIIPRKKYRSGTEGTYYKGSMPGTLKVQEGKKAAHSGFYLSLNWTIPWPGISARRFSDQIKAKLEDTEETSLHFRMQQALEKAATRAYKGKGAQ